MIIAKIIRFTAPQTTRFLARWKKRYMIVTPITEYVCLRLKMYSILTEENKHQKVERHKKVRCEKRNRNEHYKKALFGKKTSRHEMNMPGNEGHEIYRVHVNKILLSPLDLKRFLAENGMDTSAYGYRLTNADKSLMPMLGICWG